MGTPSRTSRGPASGTLPTLLAKHHDALLREWIAALSASGTAPDSGLKTRCGEFLTLFRDGVATGAENIDAAAWAPVRDFLDALSRDRAQRGFSASQTAALIFSLKEPLLTRVQTTATGGAAGLATQILRITRLLDALGLYATEVYQRSREELIQRQQEDMLELSTPVVTLWEGVLALPMIGTLDSARTQVVMETLLKRIVDTGSEIAIIDITGVPTVDTLTAQHLLKTVTAARLMGAECIISGIRPQIAQTIVHLGVDLEGVTTKATLADAFKVALHRSGRTVTRMLPTGKAATSAPPDGAAGSAPG